MTCNLLLICEHVLQFFAPFYVNHAHVLLIPAHKDIAALMDRES